ncbi:FAD-dependent oxidoreductase, partial [Candidatus Woesearchaeota archaeon]|nr:FAD-dependent oxidoreductase [Candidatus Woesearchaeota archaeon]
GVYPIIKEMSYLKLLKKAVKQAKNVTIIGGGFIGVELADEIANDKHKNVTIIEMEERLLAHSFDKEFSDQATTKLRGKGVKVLTKTRATSINGKDKATSITLGDKRRIKTDLVILGIGAKPNADLAKTCGLATNNHGAIKVDEYLKTSEPDIYAAGDCAEKKDFFTRDATNVMLASTATSEARVAGANLYAIKLLKNNKGTIAAYSTIIDDLALGSAGLTEEAAKKAGFDITTGTATAPDKHPGKLPGTKPMTVKLVFQRESGIILGGQTVGGAAAGEVTNIIALAIQKNMSISELETLQVATHPKLTAAPTAYPIINAAQQAMQRLNT